MKGPTYLFILAMFVIGLYGCEKSSNPPEYFLETIATTCFDESTIVEGSDCDDAENHWASNTFCEILHGSALYLNRNERCWIPQAMFPEDTILIFQNAEGDLLQFKLIRTSHTLNWSIAVGDDCTDGSGSIGLCNPTEKISLRLEEINDAYTITVSTGKWNDNGQDRTELTISNWFDSESRGINYFIINNGSALSAMGLHDFYESRVIARTEVYNVYTAIKHFFKYYYTQDRGLVGFEDEHGVEWVLME